MRNMVLFGPPDTHSGYGARTLDLFKAIIETYEKEFNIHVVSRRWGETPRGALKKDNPEHKKIIDRIIDERSINFPIDVSVQVSVPNEFMQYGKYNIGVTAGIETTNCSVPWIEGLNRMDVVFTSAEHGKNVFLNTAYDKQVGGVRQGVLKCEKPIEVLFEGYDEKTYKRKKVNSGSVNEMLSKIPEDFGFLVVGHWLQGDLGQDRKNIGMTINTFIEAFKNSENPPALFLKISGGSFSHTDKAQIQDKIEMIKQLHGDANLPNIYLIYGNLTNEEMNELYNHDKIKALYSLTRGEGFGRPLLEFATTGKPIIASNWSGHLDFLGGDEHILLGGKLEQVHKSAQWKDVIIPESSWFTADYKQAIGALHYTYTNYKEQLIKANKGRDRISREFTYRNMKTRIKYLFDKYIPEEGSQQLPKLQSVGELKLPKLKKVEK